MHSLPMALAMTLFLAPGALAATSHFDVQGMVCESCSEDIKASLSKLPGVKSISVDLKQAQVTVVYDGKKANPDLIVKAIDGYGFEAKLIRQPAVPKSQPPRAK